ncbi:MAG: SIMPL domain-containing protein [Bacteroidales bacterium]|nr:SIMPL domain-containing protein [Bacteroidales bacterium]
MIGLIVLGVMLPKTAKVFRSFDRTVEVRGLCEREVAADKLIWPIQFKVVGNELGDVYREVETKNAKIRKFLADGGISAEEISTATPSVSDKYSQEYGSNDRMYRYLATSTITVSTKNVQQAQALMEKQRNLIKDGIVPENGWDCTPTFLFEGLNEIKPEMIQEATRNAREVAQKFADDSESKLGKIKNATQGYFSIENRDSNTPSIKKVRVVTNVCYYLTK